MALLNDCSSNYYQTLPACILSFTVGGLTPNTTYHYFIEDKFQHVYHQEVVANAQGIIEVLASDFPAGFFNPYIGKLVMEIMSGVLYCQPVQITVCGEQYDRIVIDFKEGNFSNHIPCIC